MRKANRTFLFLALILIVLIWIALGPGLRVYLATRSSDFVNQMKTKSGGRTLVESVSGDFWSGIVLHHVVVYSDEIPDHLPILNADTVVLRFPLSSIFTRELTPSHVHLVNFNIALHIAEDGSVALPEWAFKTANAGKSQVLHSGFGFTSGNVQEIGFSCEKGVLEIIKRFPKVTEPVDLDITQLKGSGEYSSADGITIDSMTGFYLTSPVSVNGKIPKDKSKPFDLKANFGEILLASIFKDIDPLFRGNKYLPSGIGSGKIRFSGTADQLEIGGEIDLANGMLGNVAVDSAHASIGYSPGVVQLGKITAEAYGGTIEGKGQMSLLGETPQWELNCSMKDVDLGKYLVSNGYYAYEVKGGFSGTAEIKGNFRNRNLLTCTASINSDGGTYLSPFSDKFMAIAQKTKSDAAIKDTDIVSYDEAKVELDIQNSRINITKYHFVSYDLNVDAKGVVGFDKSISVGGVLSVPLAKARKNKKLGKYVMLLPDSMSRANLEFGLTGHLNDIHFDAKPTENMMRSIVDMGSDLLHKLGNTFIGGMNPKH